ncbi:MAG TPA: hypothetical protein VLJ68_11075, partial [Chitinophagaceae bacterium]|nr:hypothetical protein [Chitinophagaceae bacterium]
MFKFFTSLSFLYLFSIVVLMLYGLAFYRDFKRDGYQRKRFPFVFLLIGATCFWVLYINIHAPLRLKTFSNLDHHFLRHDGFQVARKIELGRTDTLNSQANSFNRFLLVKEGADISISAEYSEEPLYGVSGKTKLLSTSFPAAGHIISLQLDTLLFQLRPGDDHSLELMINDHAVCKAIKTIKKGSSAWNLVKDEESFINSPYYTIEDLSNALKHIFLLRDNATETGELRLFVSGKIFRYGNDLKYDAKKLVAKDLVFTSTLTDGSLFGWGISFPDNNKNQFRLKYGAKDSFTLLNRYPVSYPMISEKRTDAREDEWQQHVVNKFIVSDPKDLLRMSPVFGEGFLFTAFQGDSSIDFSPALLSYIKGAGNEPLQLKANFMDSRRTGIRLMQNKIVLPARSGSFSWMFSVRN